MKNDWSKIRAFYAELTPLILAERRDEWATDAYAWQESGAIYFTQIERWLWHDIRECGAVLYPQYPVGRFFVDFANPVAKVAIECDGADFHDAEKDAARDKELRSMGWIVYRISGKDCRTGVDDDTRKISAAGVFIRKICILHSIARCADYKRFQRSIDWSECGAVPL